MNVNFSVFIDKILSGEKRQTIRRASPKWKNAKAGDKLTLYTGLRTKKCRKLGEAVVESITPITLQSVDDWVEAHTPLGDFLLYYSDLEDLSGRDGFDGVRDFFLLARLNPDWVEWLMGWPIGWTDLKPLATGKFRLWRQKLLTF